MSQENVELARRSILGWTERGGDALMEHLDPEVDFHPPMEPLEPGIHLGHRGGIRLLME
jgi:hypothetical protein